MSAHVAYALRIAVAIAYLAGAVLVASGLGQRS